MKATVKSRNTTRMTAMLAIVHGEDGSKRSTTRHCKIQANETFVGYVLDQEKTMLLGLQQQTEALAHEIDWLHRFLETKAPAALSYRANLLYAYETGLDIEESYAKHITEERTKGTTRVLELNHEAEPLRLLAELHRAELRLKQVAQQSKAVVADIVKQSAVL